MKKIFQLLLLLVFTISMTGCYDYQAVKILNSLSMEEWISYSTILYNAETQTYIATVSNESGQVVGGYLKWGLNGISSGGGVWYPQQRELIIREALNNSGFRYISITQVPANVVWYVMNLLFSIGAGMVTFPFFMLPSNMLDMYRSKQTLVLYTVG